MKALPPLFAHRFGRAYGPDSSRKALARSIEHGVSGLEADCCLTKDGQVVLVHDPLLDGATTTTGWAGLSSAADIVASRLRHADGSPSDEHPLLLDEALDQLDAMDLTVQLEIKAHADADLAVTTAGVVCDVLERRRSPHGIREVISFWPDACASAASRGFPSRLIVACAYAPDALATWARRHGVTGVILEAPYFADAPVSTWREAGLSVMSGVVNNRSLLGPVLRYRPDAIATDRPYELAAEFRSEHGV